MQWKEQQALTTSALLLNIAGHQAVALVDNGSSHAFTNYNFAIASNCHIQPSAVRRVAVAGGEQLLSEATVPLRPYHIQGYKFSSTSKILPFQSYDVILGG